MKDKSTMGTVYILTPLIFDMNRAHGSQNMLYVIILDGMKSILTE